jgi:hypothetical protein
MKYRYTIRANGLYIPEYKKEGSDEWKPFKKKMIKGDMLQIVRALGEKSAPRRWTYGQWHFEPFDKSVFDDEPVFFTKAIYVMAFIGAAQHWWRQFEIKEVGDVMK